MTGMTVAPDGADLSREDVEYGADLVAALVGLIKQVHAFRNRLAPAGDFDLSQTFLLIRLAEAGPIRAGDLAERTCADPSTVSRQVAAMVRSGLVARLADPADGRASMLVLTEAGRARIAWNRQLRGRAVAPLVFDWTPTDRATFLRLLTALTGRFDVHSDAIVDDIRTHGPAGFEVQGVLR